MIVQYYKPNSKNTGCAFSFDIGANRKNQEPCVYVRAIKQYSWDASKRTGSFSANAKNPEKSISIKLNEIEIGGFIHAIEKYKDFSAFHSYEDNKTSISFFPPSASNRSLSTRFVAMNFPVLCCNALNT